MKRLLSDKRRFFFTLLMLCLITGIALAQRPFNRPRKPANEGPPVYADNVPKPDHDLSGRFTFSRVRFDMPGISAGYAFGELGDHGPPWSHDYPSAGRHLMKIISEVSKVDATQDTNEPIFRFGDPELYKFPFVYLCEVGFMGLSDQEITGMREYLLRGGFVCVDDFREDWQLANLNQHIKRAFPEPEYQLKKLDISHPIFNCFFSIKTLDLPPIYGGGYVARGPMLPPEFYGLEDKTGRLMMIVNYNYDVSDFWQWSDNAFAPIEQTNEAYKFGVNYIIYALTH